MARKPTFNSLRLLGALFAALAIFSFAPTGAAAGPACKSTKQNPNDVSQRSTAKATLCLLNRERRERGLKKLRNNKRLSLAAVRHARDMVDRDYFQHDSPSGTDFVARILRTDYVSRSSSYRWILGENLAWGSYSLATPRSIVKAWMDSSGHRANILNDRFREIGIGAVPGAPVGDTDNAATYATEFGARGS